jgi:hypothetical protein
MTLKSTFIFNVKQKTTSTPQLRDLDEEKVHFVAADVQFSTAQVFLNSW